MDFSVWKSDTNLALCCNDKYGHKELIDITWRYILFLQFTIDLAH